MNAADTITANEEIFIIIKKANYDINNSDTNINWPTYPGMYEIFLEIDTATPIIAS